MKLKVSREYKSEPTIVRVGNIEIGDNLPPVIIAGPCAVETFEQIRNTAKGVKLAGAHMLRGGAFKPRTTPYSFQGLEEEGLQYLKEVGSEFNLPIVSEATGENNVRLVSEYADIIQIGSRNGQNFELLKKAGQVAHENNRAVLLKRGASMTLDEFLGSAEYIVAQGCEDVILCFRGIRGGPQTELRYRSDMDEIPALRRKTHLPIFYDPSHAAGNNLDVGKQAMAALMLGANGIIIESHYNPISAITDAKQQIKPKELKGLINTINQNYKLW